MQMSRDLQWVEDVLIVADMVVESMWVFVVGRRSWMGDVLGLVKTIRLLLCLAG